MHTGPSQRIDDNAPPERTVTLLGSFQVAVRGNTVQVPEGKALSLFAYLLLHPRVSHRREQLVDRFWQDEPPGAGNRKLTNALYRLRRFLGEGWLERDARKIALDLNRGLEVDIWRFEQWAESDQPEQWRKASELYRGELLPELFEDWLLERRIAVRDTFIALLLKLAQRAERNGDLADALGWYRRLAATEPLYEEGQRGVIRMLMSLERSVEALDAYTSLEQLLEDELGVAPSQPTRQLGEQVRREVDYRARIDHPSEHRFIQPPFVGRRDERARLTAALQQTRRGQGGVCLLLGEAGVGKSRLLEEFAASAQWRGWQVAWGHGQEFSIPSPFAPLSDALISAFPQVRRRQLKPLIQPMWLEVIQRAFPAFSEENAGSVSQSAEALSPERVAIALLRLLEALQKVAPHLFILDDVHWADPGLWEVISRLREPLAQSNCMFVLAGRTENLQSDPERWKMLETWMEAGTTSIVLEGLEAPDLIELVRSVHTGRNSGNVFEESAAKLFDASNGNPLLALSLAQAKSTSIETLQTLFDRRLARLRGPLTSVLQAAAVVGYRFRYDELEELVSASGQDSSEVPALMGELERLGLITLEGERFRFQHDTLRRVVLERIPPRQLRTWHELALSVLSTKPDIRPVRLLYHAEQCGDRDAVAHYAIASGDEALSACTMKSASDFFSAALANLAGGRAESRYRALRGRLHAEDILGNRVAQKRDIDELQKIATEATNPQWSLEVMEYQANYYWAVGEYDSAEQTARVALDALARAPDYRREASLRHILGRVLREWGRYEDARDAVSKARTLFRRAGDANGVAAATDLLGGIEWQRGEYQLGADLHREAAMLFRTNGNLIREAQSLNNLGSILWSLQRYMEAREIHHRAIMLCREQGHRRGEADNLDNLGGVAWILGKYEEAGRLYSEALAIRRALNDRWGMAISLANLGSAYRLWGRYVQAHEFYAEALELNEALTRRHGIGYVEHGRGMAFLDQQDFPRALDAFQNATEIREALGDRQNWAESQTGLAQVFASTGDHDRALYLLESVLNSLDSVKRTDIRQWVHFNAFLIYRGLGRFEVSQTHLQAAHNEMLALAARFPAEEREGFMERVPLNLKVRNAVRESSRHVLVSLVADSVPLGRKLRTQDFITIEWTLYSPLDDTITRKSARRQRVIERLLTQAKLQGAAPTDGDLAAILGVTTRTIERDLATMAASGIPLSTRRRKS